MSGRTSTSVLSCRCRTELVSVAWLSKVVSGYPSLVSVATSLQMMIYADTVNFVR